MIKAKKKYPGIFLTCIPVTPPLMLGDSKDTEHVADDGNGNKTPIPGAGGTTDMIEALSKGHPFGGSSETLPQWDK